MYKITKKFENLDGVQVSEDFWFNLSKSELMDMENSDTPMTQTLMNIMREKDHSKLVGYYKDLLVKSFGIREGTTYFNKSEEISNKFKNHVAFSDIYMDMVTDETGEKLLAFIKGVFPKDMVANMNFNMSEEELNDMIQKISDGNIPEADLAAENNVIPMKAN